jgi:uncharacterized ion transporter superfamily protein YfcC
MGRGSVGDHKNVPEQRISALIALGGTAHRCFTGTGLAHYPFLVPNMSISGFSDVGTVGVDYCVSSNGGSASAGNGFS